MDKERAKKFRIKPGQKILILNPPKDFKFNLELKIKIAKKPQKEIDVIYLFAKNFIELKNYFDKVV